MGKTKLKAIFYAIVIALLVLIPFSKSLVSLYTSWLWFKAVGYNSVFTSMLTLKVGIMGAVGVAFFIFLYSNMLIARRMAAPPLYWYNPSENPLYELLKFTRNETFKRFFNLVLFATALFFAVTIGLSSSSYWNTVLKYLNKVSFDIKDPIFSLDISFHMFSMPFYRGLINIGFQAIILSIILTGLVYLINGGIMLQPGVKALASRVKTHLSILLGLFFALLAVSIKLNSYDLLLSDVGVVFGAGYADVHAKLLAYMALSVASAAMALLLIINIRLKGWKLPLTGVSILVGVSMLMSGIYPALVQQYSVSPNEIEKETPYIKQSIKFTNLAYGLNTIKEKQFPAEQELDIKAISSNKQTIDNIRLWDWQPLSKTFKQIQSIRLYYDFMDVDVDRYLVDGKYRQVAVSARELNTNDLPENANTWMNQHLVYTHGYGIVANRVNEFTEDGLPKLIVKDIPPKTDVAELKVTRPEIYFGEETNNYIVVGTKTREFDYPMGNANKYTSYKGKDGVKLDNLFKKAAFAWRFDTLKLLLSSSITSDSKVMFNRNIIERAKTIAPFLEYENDPYVVISKGRVYWLLDAYTVDNRYPYSHPFNGRDNYIRNSVKVVIDAYNGNIDYYVFDKKDPIIKTYKKAFPELFKDSSKMPSGIAGHVRYPETMFSVQSQMFATFHMTDPQVFYNKEDLWSIPEKVSDEEQKMAEPFYMVMKLPGEKKEKFMLMTPFTPTKKSNMIAWMAVKCDQDEYGQMLVYKFPKQKLVYGPMQMEARIDQTPDISQQLTLWSQRGSRVIRGNMSIIPIEDSLLYVQPIYLQSEQTELPELKRVIVSYGPKVIMADSLGSALETIFGKNTEPDQTKPGDGVDGGHTPPGEEKPLTPQEALRNLINRASEQFNNAQQKQRDGDWAGYGEEVKKLEKTIVELKQRASE